MYKRPRIKEIYPVYRLDQEHFRIGAQIGITKEFYDPTEQRPKSIAYGPAIYQLTSVVVDEAVRVLTGYAKQRSLSTQLEIDYENFSSFAHKPWPRYPDKCPTCGNGKVEDWEVFKYYGLFK